MKVSHLPQRGGDQRNIAGVCVVHMGVCCRAYGFLLSCIKVFSSIEYSKDVNASAEAKSKFTEKFWDNGYNFFIVTVVNVVSVVTVVNNSPES